MPINNSLPILYSFRRCPYAIRARLAIKVSRIQVELREVVLADKPQAMLVASPKGTVPVLILPDGSVIDESIDIMLWALNQQDPDNWLSEYNMQGQETYKLIEINDHEFKRHLDYYKYADRFPEYPMEHYRQQGEAFLQQLEARLSRHSFLLGESVSVSDMAILPFIRQFAFVDKSWFDHCPYSHVQHWLEERLSSELFQQVMLKQSPWRDGDEMTVFGGE